MSPHGPKRVTARKGGPVTIRMDLGDNGLVLSEGSVATTTKAVTEKFYEDAPVPSPT